MFALSKNGERLDQVSDEVRLASAVTADLMSELISVACERLPAVNRAEKPAPVRRLIESSAWTEAALALVEIELPDWQLRRLVFEDGQWHCSLSKQVNLPMEFDDTADASHQVLPLAILGAFIEVRRRPMVARETSTAVPRVQSLGGQAICCDNFY